MKSLFLLVIIPAVFFSSKVEWLSPTRHDFGDIRQGVPVQVDFAYRNVSGEMLTIDNVRTTCSCTTPDWSEEMVANGDTSSIQITYDARKTGYFRKKITVYFTGQQGAEKLYIEGYVE